MINPLKYNRTKTTKVNIGKVQLGGNNPIRIQSMTNTDTSDVEATVEQIIKIVDAGADFVRITVPTSVVAEKIKPIKDLLIAKGYDVPLVADIHFSPKAALISAKYLEKVRINPGNYADLKQFKHIEYTDEEYKKEVENIKTNFVPFLQVCKENNTAIRIGTNHGSLSDRILSRYGDTPLGMVESTMEFLRICKDESFNDIVISMKASNPIVMIHATRLLVKKMEEEGMNFPIHLGVTEAGNENEGRIKSAVGIGTLLADGIGDTIRVSLTEAPEKEIPVAQAIVDVFDEAVLSKFEVKKEINFKDFDFYSYKKRKSFAVKNVGGDNVPVVISDISKNVSKESILKSGYLYNKEQNVFKLTDLSADYLFVGNKVIEFKGDFDFISENENFKDAFQISNFNEKKDFENLNFVELDDNFINYDFNKFKNNENIVFVIDISKSHSPVHFGRSFFFFLEENKIKNPVIIKYKLSSYNEKSMVKASSEIGALFIDGFGDGVFLQSDTENIAELNELSFGILQACRTRITKTEYISCPSCGRTLFDLEETTAKIKAKTSHLKGVKIGIMGCIVNGPGEMADADFGYVGTGTGKITLYKKQEVIKRNIPEKDAVEELLNLIKQYS
ncbi:MAG: (E)-4-hydroxy-3-methylbut-2-enyl-diphosphate synthase [Chlorobi bacterium]|nr:(E)-4-hydroxy-3-methylbut-2-enyl-diphosphate synthase [Chlorobiota bacterium]